MTKRTMFTMFVAAALFALATMAGSASAQQGAASAELEDAEGNPVGTATFTEGPDGVVIDVAVEEGVEPGEHGIHIHESDDLSSSDFESAGDHFNPTGAEHGFDNPEGPHAGDLENITVEEDGTASYQTINDRITLERGPENSLFDSDGSSLIIHEMPDDNMTNDDPETGPGMSGDRVAAGVIEADAAATEIPDTGGPGLSALAGLALLAAGSLLIFFRARRSAA